MTTRANKLQAELKKETYQPPTYTSAINQAKTGLAVNGCIIFAILLVLLFSQVNQKRYRISFYAALLVFAISLLNWYVSSILMNEEAKANAGSSGAIDPNDPHGTTYADDAILLCLCSIGQLLFTKRPSELYERRSNSRVSDKDKSEEATKQ